VFSILSMTITNLCTSFGSVEFLCGQNALGKSERGVGRGGVTLGNKHYLHIHVINCTVSHCIHHVFIYIYVCIYILPAYTDVHNSVREMRKKHVEALRYFFLARICFILQSWTWCMDSGRYVCPGEADIYNTDIYFIFYLLRDCMCVCYGCCTSTSSSD
jgi:hypothetical protein